MQSGSRNHCADNGNRNRNYDDLKRCKTAEKEIRNIDIKKTAETTWRSFHFSVWFFGQKQGKTLKKETKRIIQTLGKVLFVLYVLALIYFLFFSEEYGRVAIEERQYRYNLVPFVEIRRFWVYRKQLGFFAVFTNLFGNVAGFLPFGFMLPVISERMRSGWMIILSGFGLSVTVEVIQLITKVGCFDVDDMILNTAGAALGYLLFFICDHLRRKIYGKKI